jgi:hypothetical protein
MATNKKITELTELSEADLSDDDVLPIVDVSAGTTNKVRKSTLASALSGVSSITATSPIAVNQSTGAIVVSTGTIPIAKGGTGETSASGARTSLGVAASGANTDITSLDAGLVISGSTASDALRITQTGAGNALVVEDSANPDSSPFVVDASGNVGIGTTSPSGGKMYVVQAADGLNAGFRITHGSGDARMYINANTPTLDAAAGGRLDFSIGGVASYNADASRLAAFNAAGPALLNETASSTNPTLVPNKADPDTGVSGNGADIGFLVAGSVEVLRWESSGRIGIGILSPGTFTNGLAVAGSGNNGDVAVINDTVGAWSFKKVRSDNSNAMGIYDPTGFGAMALYTAGAERMLIDSSGTATLRSNVVIEGNVSADSGTFDTLTTAAINGGQLAGFRNRIINGNFAINQRVYSSGSTLSSGTYGHDRWKAGASGGDYSFTQSANGCTITIAAGKTLIQVVEDANLEGGTYVLSWSGTAQARYAVNSSTPSGTYADSPIIISGQLASLGMSVEFDDGTLSGVQLELNSTATPFEQRGITTELLLCQRYFCKTFPQSVAPANGLGTAYFLGYSVNTGNPSTIWKYPVTMRTTPTVTLFNDRAGGTAGQWNNSLADSANARAIGTSPEFASG